MPHIQAARELVQTGKIGKVLKVKMSWNRNTVKLPQGPFKTDLVGVRMDFAFSPKMFLVSFIQYNTDARIVTTNVRFRFIHHPLSDVFIVLNEQRILSPLALATGRSLVVKVTQMVSF